MTKGFRVEFNLKQNFKRGTTIVNDLPRTGVSADLTLFPPALVIQFPGSFHSFRSHPEDLKRSHFSFNPILIYYSPKKKEGSRRRRIRNRRRCRSGRKIKRKEKKISFPRGNVAGHVPRCEFSVVPLLSDIFLLLKEYRGNHGEHSQP